MRKKFCFILFFVLILTACSNKISETFISDINVGSYISFGQYESSPIIWRVIHKENNSLLLWSDKLLTNAAFDTPGDYFQYSPRRDEGSCQWEYSNIRQWLNSDDGMLQIDWIQNSPSPKNTYPYELSYNYKRGFLHESNFTVYEKTLIETSSHKVLLSELDASKAIGGEKVFELDDEHQINNSNYKKSYYQNINDTIFLLSLDEVDNYILNNDDIDPSYIFGYPSESFLDNAWDDPEIFATNLALSYWTRTPSGINYVISIGENGTFYGVEPYLSLTSGIRPALKLNENDLYFSQGDGTINSPFIISKP